MRKFTLAALTAFFAVSLSAQNKCTVSGYIRDAATGGDAHRSGSYGDGDGCCVRGEDLRNIVGDESHSDDTSGKCYRGNVRCECFRYKV